MSYFSHNPEKWDEIELNGVLEYVLAHDPNADEEEVRENLGEIQSGNTKLWHQMTAKASKFIESQEESFWSTMADAHQ